MLKQGHVILQEANKFLKDQFTLGTNLSCPENEFDQGIIKRKGTSILDIGFLILVVWQWIILLSSVEPITNIKN